MNPTFLKIYQSALFSLGAFIILVGLYSKLWALSALGVFIAAMSAGTVWHLVSGKHNKFSKLPKDVNSQR